MSTQNVTHGNQHSLFENLEQLRAFFFFAFFVVVVSKTEKGKMLERLLARCVCPYVNILIEWKMTFSYAT